MAVAATRRHDEHVHTCSLAQAMAAAAKRQRGRIHTWRPGRVPSLSAVEQAPVEPEAPRLPVETLRASALAQQREATELRSRAREMLASNEDMRLRLARFAAQVAERHDRRADT